MTGIYQRVRALLVRVGSVRDGVTKLTVMVMG